MSLEFAKRLEGYQPDPIGQLLRALNALPTWTREKFELWGAFQKAAGEEGYKRFTGDSRDCHTSTQQSPREQPGGG